LGVPLKLKISALVLLFSAVSVIYVSFEHRKITHQWQALGDQHNKFQEEYGRLMLEYSTLAAPSRVEAIARQKIKMIFPNKNNTRVIQIHEQ
jgi:cell division protein FtsL